MAVKSVCVVDMFNEQLGRASVPADGVSPDAGELVDSVAECQS